MISICESLVDKIENSKNPNLAVVSFADSLFTKRNYCLSYRIYSGCKQDAHVTSRINDIDKMVIHCDSDEEQYFAIIQTAEKYVKEGNHEKALLLFQRALAINPNDPYPKKRITDLGG
ncbi:tetratricopeptide repeat protein [Paracrocinitomix mangrovi]|uniref:tetratricopeptide repeat protein n=1 Tax=Paracrocinitomix mangrovi TaxID=2862509 RepID=UPI001EDC21AD|nr:tetratricopeptide repeat protein [Paracrocinitomix mangrovi]UKN03452.1 tetratricopeptide repeat protein [Paracrocinitomix mangrovi]